MRAFNPFFAQEFGILEANKVTKARSGRKVIRDPVLRDRLPDEAKLGPCMKALSESHRLFVLSLLDQGTRLNLTNAYKSAGYEACGVAARVGAHRLGHDPRIQAALLEESRKRTQLGTVAATAYLLEVIQDGEVDTRERLKAAGMILDRGGMHSLTEHRVEISHNDNRLEKILRVAELARLTGQDPKALLGNLSDVVEADFEIIEQKSA